MHYLPNNQSRYALLHQQPQSYLAYNIWFTLHSDYNRRKWLNIFVPLQQSIGNCALLLVRRIITSAARLRNNNTTKGIFDKTVRSYHKIRNSRLKIAQQVYLPEVVVALLYLDALRGVRQCGDDIPTTKLRDSFRSQTTSLNLDSSRCCWRSYPSTWRW